MDPGDILLIELHAPGPNATGSGQFGYVPMEFWPDNFDAIRAITDLGYLVVEAAGNGQQDLDDAIYGGDLAYIRLIWHTSCQSMLDWHSPPDWFQVPSTFLQWYNDSQERADAIQGAIQMMNALRQTRNEFDRIRFAAEETHREILEALEDTEPIIQIHNDMLSLFRGLSWAAFAHD